MNGPQWPKPPDPWFGILDGRALMHCGCSGPIDTHYWAHLVPGGRIRCILHGMQTITAKTPPQRETTR